MKVRSVHTRFDTLSDGDPIAIRMCMTVWSVITPSIKSRKYCV